MRPSFETFLWACWVPEYPHSIKGRDTRFRPMEECSWLDLTSMAFIYDARTDYALNTAESYAELRSRLEAKHMQVRVAGARVWRVYQQWLRLLGGG